MSPQDVQIRSLFGGGAIKKRKPLAIRSIDLNLPATDGLSCSNRNELHSGWAVEPSILYVRVCEPKVGQRRGLPDLVGEGSGPDAAHA